MYIAHSFWKTIVVFAVVASWGALAYYRQFLEHKHMMGGRIIFHKLEHFEIYLNVYAL